ncbi:Uncharacterised protein [Sphingobacterium daejeonense]|nr:Uncharacterised protein [Sphingobacterium daejeonense]
MLQSRNQMVSILYQIVSLGTVSVKIYLISIFYYVVKHLY